ncbi:maleylpyruvate isomerase family mycothiol-dependent enzyme [Arthrobacter jiangjiafuii]|uniref:Maleylpyruvate isomerase family mycothiol-dependent enzyme n=1 Tax=Arthrobacter jiangjiafuii TaxID=2817475 RepID=A0A975R1E5_9MICC|nr:maleylpyruvate isomerase family mycothiol-dependent enzyme [Arthrobacter jiangjiafuii]MBP3044806.1 maleylpyruvate isomerase family mycothiol-dependent enzyme [Arthrobacter jiangjiafuii]QWC10369.1 maleylpyruvate isomerase family mycothiol-dependent enzyme [Arthrobacter jiangjiafuii]
MPFRRSAPVWPAVHSERRALIRDLETLAPELWAQPSLCPGWDIHDVVAHLVDSAKTTRLSFLRGLIAAKFDFDKQNANGIARARGATPEATLAEFRRIRDETKTPPAAPATRLVEAIVHGEDIRRPLGILHSYPGASVDAALRYQLKTGVSMGGGKERAAGFRLQASDTGLEHGSGPVVRGSSLVLLLAVSGRPVAEEEFSGAGAAMFVRKLNQTS